MSKKEKVIKVICLLRRDTLQNWTINNPILRSGELSYVTDLGKCKCGDGKTHWLDLPYFILNTDYNDFASIIIKTKKQWQEYDKVISKQGTLYVYTDEIENGSSPEMRIGDGSSYICDLPPVGGGNAQELQRILDQHISDNNIHVTTSEKEFWNNKLNIIEGDEGIIDNTLIFNRD